jgi:predicted site-specific integrase-resolvase
MTRGAAAELLTPAETADLLRVTTKTLRNWRYLERGPAPCYVNGRARYRRGDVESFVA